MNKASKQPAWLVPVLSGATFFYFLVFAQFGYLHVLADLEANGQEIDLILMCMGIGGVAGSLCAVRCVQFKNAANVLLAGFSLMGASAYIAGLARNQWVQAGIGFSVGFSLAIVTVVLVPVIRALLRGRNTATIVSLGVGGAYFLCNMPFVFNASGWTQCILAAASCCIGVTATLFLPAFDTNQLLECSGHDRTPVRLFSAKGILATTALFVILIWYDSSAFYLMQDSETLHNAAWSGSETLMMNAFVHLAAAILAGWLIDKGWIFPVLAGSFLLLLAGYALSSTRSSLIHTGTLIYLTAVSAYSCALVSYGALAPQKQDSWSIAARSGMVFAVGGWIASGMGIGMAKDLHRIPAAFVASLLVVLALCTAVLFMSKSIRRDAT